MVITYDKETGQSVGWSLAMVDACSLSVDLRVCPVSLREDTASTGLRIKQYSPSSRGGQRRRSRKFEVPRLVHGCHFRVIGSSNSHLPAARPERAGKVSSEADWFADLGCYLLTSLSEAQFHLLLTGELPPVSCLVITAIDSCLRTS